MIQLLTYIFGSFGVKVAWYVLYYGFNTVIIAFYIGFVAWVFQIFTRVYNQIETLVNTISSNGSDALTSQIFGLLNCMGVIDGLVAGLPILLTALLTVIAYFAGRHLYNFYQTISKLIIGWKP